MQIIAVAVIKGGTGKSTSSAALAQAAAADGRRVLAIDLDPQANLTFALGADQNRAGSFQVITGTPAATVIQETVQRIDVISASPDLATLKTSPASAKRLQTAIEPLRAGYDLIVIDTPPTLGELTYNALQAATGLLIPLEADTQSLQGLYQITDMAHQFQERANTGLRIIGFVLTRYDGRPRFNRYMKEAIEARGAEIGAPFLMAIRKGVAVAEAAAMQQSLFDYAPNSKPAQDYMRLYEMITEE